MRKFALAWVLMWLSGCGSVATPLPTPVRNNGVAAKFFESTTGTIKPNLFDGKKYKGLMVTVQPLFGGAITYDMVHLAIKGVEKDMCVCALFLGKDGNLYLERTASGNWQDSAIVFSRIGTYATKRFDTGAPVSLTLAPGISVKKITHQGADGAPIPEIVMDVTALPPAEDQAPVMIPALDPGEISPKAT